MATNAVNIGKAYASGMMKTAPAGTALPATITKAAVDAWGTEVGFVSEDGMTLNLSRDKENIKDWSKTIRRVVLTDHEESASGSCISTDADAFESLFGTDAVTTSGDTTKVELSKGTLPAPKAFLFVMNDGDDWLAFGCEEGQMAVTDNVSLPAGNAIEWPFEVTAMGDDGMVFIKTAGQEES